ncbi:ATP-binding protein [Actinoplanes derwentensis]|uniref:ATP-binding protein n=1 Tax=Actinoplanes derwentensis TaxID=113562 RepID=UPI000B82C272|nr:ATP-binding protein [Actinoplanes derwentensis]GID88373.1 hypothetical protein Ade03nite_72970 [Actinoplanes derwentensis]
MTAKTLCMLFKQGEPAAPMRSTARAALTPWHSADQIDDVLVVVSELVQNVSQHTEGGGTLVLNWDDHSITVEVSDDDRRMPLQRPPDDQRLGGRGLLLVDGICSSWGATAHDHGKTVWARVTPARMPVLA